jgi:hypothetical protein
MSTLTRRDIRGPFGDMVDWLETPWTMLRPIAGHPMRAPCGAIDMIPERI